MDIDTELEEFIFDGFTFKPENEPPPFMPRFYLVNSSNIVMVFPPNEKTKDWAIFLPCRQGMGYFVYSGKEARNRCLYSATAFARS